MCDLFDPNGDLNQGHLDTITRIVDRYMTELDAVCAPVAQRHRDGGAFASFVDNVDELVVNDWNHYTAPGLARVAEIIWPTVAHILEASR